MKLFFLSLTLSISLLGMAQSPATSGSGEILSGLQKLKVLGSVLYMAAHPDDENTRLLAWLSKEKMYRTGYLSLTRGDGGQNLIGEEQGIALGLIRTQELLAARRVDGAEQFFSRAFDFGFSKSTAEAFAVWNKEKILSDAVWVIRKFRPDIIITRFPGDARAGHGHHSASAVIANEAFTAAADTKRFPEQFKFGVEPWQAKRIFWNTFNFGGNNTISNDQLKVDVGVFNAILGKSYGEIAAESRSQHKSQGFGVPASRGSSYEYFVLTGGEGFSKDIMDGIVTDWARIPGGESIQQQIDALIAGYQVANPSASVKGLVQLYKDVDKLKSEGWKAQKLKEIQTLIERCSGLFLEVSTPQPYAVQGDTLRFNINAINRSNVDINLKNVVVNQLDATIKRSLANNIFFNLNAFIEINQKMDISQPYWLKDKMEKGSFQVTNQELIGKPQNDPSIVAKFMVDIENQPFEFQKPLQYKHTDPVKGELYQPLSIVPPISVNTSPAIMLFRKDQITTKNVTVEATAYMNIDSTSVTLHQRRLEQESDESGVPLFIEKNKVKKFDIPVSNKKMEKSSDLVNVSLEYKNVRLDQANYLAMANIQYDHIPEIRYFYQDGVTVLNLDVKTSGKKAGYIKGAGDKIPEALEQLGYEVTYLQEQDITSENLKKFDVVITGIRAYNIHEWLNTVYETLMNYVYNGGIMLVQYNTNNGAGPMRKGKIGPYDFTITNTRTTNEESEAHFLDAKHPLMNYPNKISAKDFDGWIQERGIYYANNFSTNYTPLIGFKDFDETTEAQGSLISTNYGKGRFTYTGLVLFRELPAGVGGAYRILANLIAK